MGLFWCWVVLRKTRLVVVAAHGARADGVGHLAAEAVEGAALALERVDDVSGNKRHAERVFAIAACITDDVLEEDLEDTPGLFVDQTGDPLDATSASQPPDGRLGDALDVVPKDLPVTLGAALAESFTSFSSSRHV